MGSVSSGEARDNGHSLLEKAVLQPGFAPALLGRKLAQFIKPTARQRQGSWAFFAKDKSNAEKYVPAAGE